MDYDAKSRAALLRRQCKMGELTACITLQGLKNAKQTAESLEDCGCEDKSPLGSPGSLAEEKPRRQARPIQRDPGIEEPAP